MLGQAVGPNGRGPWSQVGHLVERPTAYPELTVRENLEIARRLHGISDHERHVPRHRTPGACRYADRKAGTLSTGNLQRLGLARALLHEPELLILDEPANGLDPAGVVEIRELLASLAREQGVTVFMSSHILTEVDRLATRIGIIHKGRLIEELDAEKLEDLRSRRLEIRTRDLEAAQSALTQAGFAVKANEQHDFVVRGARRRCTGRSGNPARQRGNTAHQAGRRTRGSRGSFPALDGRSPNERISFRLVGRDAQSPPLQSVSADGRRSSRSCLSWTGCSWSS